MMDQRRAVERLLVLLIGLLVSIQVVLSANDTYPMDQGPVNNETATPDNTNNSTMQQPGVTVATPLLGNSTVATSGDNTDGNTDTNFHPPTNSTTDAFPANPGTDTANPGTNDTGNGPWDFNNESTDDMGTFNGTQTESDTGTMVTESPVQMGDNTTGYGVENYNGSSNATQGQGNTGGGGGGGGEGDGWNNSSASVTSNAPGRNQTSNMTTPTPAKSILCYNCSGDNCRNQTSNDTGTCVSNTGTCYTHYNSATTLTLSCTSLLSGGNGACAGNYATRIVKSSCELCCKTPLCNQKTTSNMEQVCRQQLDSSADHIGGRCALLAALIAVIHSISVAETPGDW